MILPLPLDLMTGWLLASLRAGTMLMLLPILGGGTAPGLGRVLLSLMLGAALAPMSSVPAPDHVPELLLLSGREVAVGAALGMLARTLLLAPHTAGDILAQEMGLRLAQEVDPMTRIQSTAIGRLYEMSILLVFLAIHGPADLVHALHHSFDAFPVGLLTVPAGLPALVSGLQAMLEAAVVMVAPLLVILFLGSLMLALLAKTVPQLQVLTFGYPLRLLGALLIAAWWFPLLQGPGERLAATVREHLWQWTGA